MILFRQDPQIFSKIPAEGIADSLELSVPQAVQCDAGLKCGTQEGHTGLPALIIPALMIGFSHLTQIRPLHLHEPQTGGPGASRWTRAEPPQFVQGFETKTRG